MNKEKKAKQKEEKKPKVKVLGMFFSFLKGSYLMFALTVVTIIIGMFFYMLIPRVTSFVIDGIIEGKPATGIINDIANLFGGTAYIKEHYWMIGIAVIVISAIQATAAYFRRICANQTGEIVAKNIKDRMFRHILSLPFSWHSTMQTGDIIQRATQDSNMVKMYVSNQLMEFLRTLALVVIAAMMMFFMNVRMTLIALSFTPVVLLISALISPKISKHFEETDAAEGMLTAKLQENLTGIRVVRAFGRQAQELQQYDEKNEVFVGRWKKFTNTVSAFWGTGDLLPAIQKLVVLVVGTYIVVRTNGEDLSVGELLAFVTYNAMIIWPIRNIGRILGETGKVNASLRRIKEVMKETPEPVLAHEGEQEISGEIEFKNVSFSYTPERKILDDVSFKIKKGSTFGIIGGTGSGKSTIAQLINRLYDVDEGGVFLSGTDVKDIKRSHIRRHVGLVLQEPFLFSKSVKDNITLPLESYSEEELSKYISIASLDSTVEEIKEGLDTVVGEKGGTFSGGQKQRMVIARTLIQKTPIVIFDDSLSAVDTETDYKIRTALAENLKNTTTVIISHRISSLMHADKILVLDSGRVSDSGTHKELIRRKGIYKSLYDLQMEIAEEEKEFLTGGQQ